MPTELLWRKGATSILVEQTADHVEDSSREKTYGIEIHPEWKARNHPKAGRNNSENTKGRDIEKEVEDCGLPYFG